MTGTSRVARAIRYALLSSAMTAAAAANVRADERNTEEVIVTGSRIARPDVKASTPLQVVNAQAIEQQGAQNIYDILAQLPVVGTSTYSRANSNFLTFGNGVSTVNLRNMDDKRTLVLVNGRRLVSGIGGTSTVDINNIPTDLVKKVEILTGGTSAVYGSEAVAGVVNFILKDDFEGLSLRGQTGRTSHNDNDRHMVSLTGGRNFGATGNVTVNVQYDRDDGLRSRRRALSKNDVPFRSSFTPQGVFFAGEVWTYDANNTLIDTFDSDEHGFNRNAERYISVPLERTLVTALGHVGIADTTEAFFEASYSQMKSRSRLEAFATDNSDAVLPDGTALAGLTLDNPFIPDAIRQDMIDSDIDVLEFSKRLNGVFDRSNRNERDFYRGVVGLRGDVVESWQWEAYYEQSRTRDDTGSETALRDRYYYALDAIRDPATGRVVCRDAAARAAGCAPFDPFGFDSASAAAAAYITNDGQLDTYEANIDQRVAAFNLTGPVFALPAGDVQLAAGLEYREEQSSEVYSADTQSGNTMGNAAGNTSGKYHVREAYLETIVPLLSGLAAVDRLDFEGAMRLGDYSTVGAVFSWKAGLNWSPVHDVKLRGMYAVATRAPSIGELFASPAQTFPSGLTDPCEGTTAASTGAVADYCRSIPGIAQQIAANGLFAYDENADLQSIEGTDFGNPDVKEEKGKTLTLGIVFAPGDLPMSLSVDYFRIKITDAITLFPRQAAINACVSSLGASPFCSLMVREAVNTPRPRTPGTIFSVDSLYFNAASIETAGVDVGLRHGFDFGLSTALTYTYLEKLELRPAAGLPVENNRGQLNGEGRLGAGFKHRAQLDLGYAAGAFSATWTAGYQSSMKDTRVDPPLDPQDNRVDTYVYHDAQLRYTFGSEAKYVAYLGVDNVFDKKPPRIGQNGVSNILGTETAAESYDPIGRFIYTGVQLGF